MPTRPKQHRQQQTAPRHGERKTAARRGYGYRWQVASQGWLRAHPFCVACERDGRMTLATCVDHIVPHRGDAGRFWDSGRNWQSLCASCHSAKTVREDGGFGR